MRQVRVLLRRAGGRVALTLGSPQERYRRWFVAEYGTLRNIYLNRVETLDLADSYVSLSVRAENETGGARLPATDLMAASGPRRIVIVGDPGSGKSTLLKAYGSGVLRRAAGDSELDLVGRTNEIPILAVLGSGKRPGLGKCRCRVRRVGVDSAGWNGSRTSIRVPGNGGVRSSRRSPSATTTGFRCYTSTPAPRRRGCSNSAPVTAPPPSRLRRPAMT